MLEKLPYQKRSVFWKFVDRHFFFGLWEHPSCVDWTFMVSCSEYSKLFKMRYGNRGLDTS